MAFYNRPEFNRPELNDPPGNPRPLTAQFAFNQAQRDQISDFLRALNTLQNIDVARRELKEILDNRRDNPRAETDKRLQTAFEETQDAIDVLTASGISPSALNFLTIARSRIAQAQSSTNNSERRALVQQARDELKQARGVIAV